MSAGKKFIYQKCHFKMHTYNLFILLSAGFKFRILSLLVAVFQQLKCCISCRLPLTVNKFSFCQVTSRTQPGTLPAVCPPQLNLKVHLHPFPSTEGTH